VRGWGKICEAGGELIRMSRGIEKGSKLTKDGAISKVKDFRGGKQRKKKRVWEGDHLVGTKVIREGAKTQWGGNGVAGKRENT